MKKFISKQHLEMLLVKAEEALNLVGYIPVISAFSGAVRSVGGIVQIIFGLLFALAHFLKIRFLKAPNIRSILGIKDGLAHGFHGLANFIRAKIELVPFLSLFTCLPYDRILNKRFKYASESIPEVVEDPDVIDI
jgi:hypothetical protein